MKHYTLKSFAALMLALLLVLSLSSAAFAAPTGYLNQPIVQIVVNPDLIGEDAAERSDDDYTASRDAVIGEGFQLRPEEEIWSRASSAVASKVTQIVKECRAAGVTGEYETALWLHDWLTGHATYDKSLKIYGPDGVLLQGSGVCQSYRSAYQLLLDEAGIENTFINSEAMNHTWNLVKIDGEWCHVDVTWDDPTLGGTANDPIVSGSERHTYFGMSDEVIKLDHSWEPQDVPAATSLKNYYPVRNGDVCYTNFANLDEQLSAKAAAKTNPLNIQYIGADTSRSAVEDFMSWFSDNSRKYGMSWTTYSCSQYTCEVQVRYDQVTQQSKHLESPVTAPNFTFSGPEGSFSKSQYSGSVLVLIFGRTSCSNTRALLDDLYDSLSSLHNDGIEVLVNLDGASAASDLSELQAQWPNYHYSYGDMNAMWSYLSAAGNSGSVSFPCVFVVNKSGMITYYSTGYVSTTQRLLDEAKTASNYAQIVEIQNMAYAITAPADLITLEDIAFENARFSSADLATAPLNAIGSRAFAGNAKLRYVRIPDSVSFIADDAFSDCPNVTLVCSFDSWAAQYARFYKLSYVCP